MIRKWWAFAWAFSLLSTAALATSSSAPTLTNGIKFGEGRLHTYFDLESHYDTAAGYFPGSPSAQANGLSPEIVNHFRPGLSLDVPSDNFAFQMDGNLDYLWYTGLLTPNDSKASRLQAEANLAAQVNPKGTVGLELSDRFARSDRTRNAAVAVGVLSLYNEANAAVPIRPGGGALELIPSAGYGVEFFSPILAGTVTGCTLAVCNANSVSAFNYQNIRVGLGGRYRFLPKTALVLDANFDQRSYFTPGANLPASLLRASAGLAGLLAPRIAATVKAGYGKDFVGNAGTAIGQAEISYLATADSTLKAGYIRTLAPVPVYGVFGDDRFYVDGVWAFGERVRVHGLTSYDILTFYGQGRHDTDFQVQAGPEWDILRWLNASVGYTLEIRRSDASGSALFNFNRHEGFARLSVRY